jgi:hypothetical protein
MSDERWEECRGWRETCNPCVVRRTDTQRRERWNMALTASAKLLRSFPVSTPRVIFPSAADQWSEGTNINIVMMYTETCFSRTRWACSRRQTSATALLLGSWVWIPLRARLFVSCVCCVLCLCDVLVTFRRDLKGVCVCVFVCTCAHTLTSISVCSRNLNYKETCAQFGLL